MRIILIFTSLLITSVSIQAIDVQPKYKPGDCITPTAGHYTWHGQYAKVQAFSAIEGLTKNNSYILAFPFYASNHSIYDKEIELFTKKVSKDLCKQESNV